MGDESPKPASTPTGAVFLSYASQDAEAAQRICDALRAAGIEVWFDKSELKGGDVWDRQIREQIHDCRLFIPIISANTNARDEGYFRREWGLAVDRTRDMDEKKAFLLPVVIDDTVERSARVPERFHGIQWTRLLAGLTPPAFVARVRKLLSPGEPDRPAKSHPPPNSVSVAMPAADRRRFALRRSAALVAVATVVVVALGYIARQRMVPSKPPLQPATAHSIAVLPLANESGDASQQYFSDGLSEDLITTLSQIPGLKVIGRHSSFQFRDSKDDSKTIGAKLGVTHLLEGSVRHAGDTVRVSAELIDTLDGSTRWSERYDRPYKDLFALQDDITRAVAGALKARLLPSEHAPSQSDRPPSGNLDAYNALLQGKSYYLRRTEDDYRKAIEQFTAATHFDPKYALAWSSLSIALSVRADEFLSGADARRGYAEARAAADTALALAPDLSDAHVARGLVLGAEFDWRGSETEFRRALELAPNDGRAKANLGNSLASLGQVQSAVDLLQQAIVDDPLHAEWLNNLGNNLAALGRLDEGERTILKSIELQPNGHNFHTNLAGVRILRGDPGAALAAAEQEPPGEARDLAVALARQIGSDRAGADAALQSVIDRYADRDAYGIAEIYAVRHNADKIFEWLDRAWINRDGGIGSLLSDPLILRYKEDPRFSAFCRKVGLPTPAEVEKRT
jgi:TolB-like protein/Tfp pilus assembly protein PilF